MATLQHALGSGNVRLPTSAAPACPPASLLPAHLLPLPVACFVDLPPCPPAARSCRTCSSTGRPAPARPRRPWSLCASCLALSCARRACWSSTPRTSAASQWCAAGCGGSTASGLPGRHSADRMAALTGWQRMVRQACLSGCPAPLPITIPRCPPAPATHQQVRDKIKNFAANAVGPPAPGFPSPPFKVIILDEADAMTGVRSGAAGRAAAERQQSAPPWGLERWLEACRAAAAAAGRRPDARPRVR